MLINIELGELDPPAAVIDRRYRTFALKLTPLPASLAATRAALPSMSRIPFAPFYFILCFATPRSFFKIDVTFAIFSAVL